MTTGATRCVKLIALTVTALSVVGFSFISRGRSALAEIDDTLEQIAAYRTWKRITKEPIKGASLAVLLDPATKLPAGQPVTIDLEAIGGG